MVTREEKPWGHKLNIRPGVDLLFVKAGHRCSWHCHFSTENSFRLIDGDFAVVYRDDDGKDRYQHVTQNSTFTVDEGMWHEFRAYQDSVVVEYGFDPADIMRDPSQLGGSFCIEEDE